MIQMPKISLVRLESTDHATLGAIVGAGEILCLSLELPWRDNQTNVSCIPCGQYKLRRRVNWFNAERYGHTYEVDAVFGRTGILIHPANAPSELLGCIAPGSTIGDVTIGGARQRGVKSSGVAFSRLMEFLADVETASLSISQLTV